MVTTHVTSKGQVVIPARIRRRLGIRKGTQLIIEDRGDEIVMRPLTKDFFNKFVGVLKGKESLSMALLGERARDRAREDRA